VSRFLLGSSSSSSTESKEEFQLEVDFCFWFEILHLFRGVGSLSDDDEEAADAAGVALVCPRSWFGRRFPRPPY
jgi:hypothetical protein